MFSTKKDTCIFSFRTGKEGYRAFMSAQLFSQK